MFCPLKSSHRWCVHNFSRHQKSTLNLNAFLIKKYLIYSTKEFSHLYLVQCQKKFVYSKAVSATTSKANIYQLYLKILVLLWRPKTTWVTAVSDSVQLCSVHLNNCCYVWQHVTAHLLFLIQASHKPIHSCWRQSLVLFLKNHLKLSAFWIISSSNLSFHVLVDPKREHLYDTLHNIYTIWLHMKEATYIFCLLFTHVFFGQNGQANASCGLKCFETDDTFTDCKNLFLDLEHKEFTFFAAKCVNDHKENCHFD